MNITEKLMDMKDQIEDAEKEKGHLEGKISALKDNLENKYGCSSVEELKEKDKLQEEEKKEKKEKLSEIVSNLEENFD